MEISDQPVTEQTPFPNKFLQRGREGKNDWWRYLLGILITFIGGYAVIGQIPLLGLMMYGVKHGYINPLDKNIETSLLNPQIMHVDPNIILLIEMFIFVGGMFALWLSVRFLHKKKFIAIITSASKIRWKRFGISFLVWSILCFGSQFISMAMYPDNYTYVFKVGPFLTTLAIGLIFLPIQTWWEEFFFRGYIFQGIGLITKRALTPVLLTGTIFALVHMANPEVAKYGVAAMLPAYLLPGLFLGLMAALDEGLESAMGMHFANNLFGTIGVTSSASAIQANTIWVGKEMNPGADNLTLFISFFILLTILWKTNKWDIKKLIH